MNGIDDLMAARAAVRKAVAAEARAKAAREERDGAVLAAYFGGVKPPTIARETGLGLPLVRKIIRTGSSTEET